MSATAPTTLDTSMTSPAETLANFGESLTWQQQEDLGAIKHPKSGRRKRRAAQPAPDIATKPTGATTTNHASNPEQSKVRPPSAQLKVHTKAHPQWSPHQSKQPADVNTAPPQQGRVKVTKEPRTNRSKRKARPETKPAEMTTQTPGPSIPPHLRRRIAVTTQPKADIKLGDIIAVNTPPASVRSRVEELAPVDELTQPLLEQAVVQEQIPLTPATTAPEPQNKTCGYESCDQPLPGERLAPSKQKKNPRWQKTSTTPKDKYVWPKTREIPRNLSGGSQSDGGVTFRSNSDGDPSYDVKKLMDWNGDWLPPPEEWAARKGFTHRHFGQAIEQWATGHSRNCTNPMLIDSPDFSGVKQANNEWLTKDLVPRYWLQDLIDTAAPRKFWEELPHRAPAPLSDVDIFEHPPYWERWEEGQPDNCFMKTLVVPEARIDRSDRDNELGSRFAMLSANDRLAAINDIKASKRRRGEARRNRPVINSMHEGAQSPDRHLKPKANMYLRPVQPADVRGIATIYNHYIKNTVHAAETDEQTEAQISSWIDGIVRAGLPCLVAIAKRNQRKVPQGYVSETVIGFIHLEEYAGLSSMYRYTFELALYVHPGYIRQGVGKCLLDQLMYLSHTGYDKKGGFEYVNEFEYLKNGKHRTIKTILAGAHYERGAEIEWIADYLGEFGFRKAGRFSYAGYKIGQVIDKTWFQVQTSEVIDAKGSPAIQA
ncbi:hypothetical protein SVAN01_02703 [Stagonosporopsis vannaccii]|nr:hypothetical protein SVAN01_02703 [Stagonosporopsis vannaccii]